MAADEIYQRCAICGGDGFVESNTPDTPGTITCSYCSGSGFVLFGRVSVTDALTETLESVESKIDKILETLPDICKHPGGGH